MKTPRKLKKNTLKAAFAVGFILLLVQCTVMSFHPLYTKDELVKDDRIIGTWMSRLVDEEVSSDSLVWEIYIKDNKNKNAEPKSEKEFINSFKYKLKLYPIESPEDWLVFDIHIVELDGQYYLDFLLEQYEKSDNNILRSIHLYPVHTFAKLEINNNQLVVKWLDGEFLEDLLEQNKIRIRHEVRSDGSLLTAKPKELQKFIIKYANRPDAYCDDLSFILTPFHKE